MFVKVFLELFNYCQKPFKQLLNTVNKPVVKSIVTQFFFTLTGPVFSN